MKLLPNSVDQDQGQFYREEYHSYNIKSSPLDPPPSSIAMASRNCLRKISKNSIILTTYVRCGISPVIRQIFSLTSTHLE